MSLGKGSHQSSLGNGYTFVRINISNLVKLSYVQSMVYLKAAITNKCYTDFTCHRNQLREADER